MSTLVSNDGNMIIGKELEIRLQERLQNSPRVSAETLKRWWNPWTIRERNRVLELLVAGGILRIADSGDYDITDPLPPIRDISLGDSPTPELQPADQPITPDYSENLPTILPISQITRDRNIQPREKIAGCCVHRYADSMKSGVVFPPLKVFKIGNQYLLVDGFHRLAAYEHLGITNVSVDIVIGTIEDARLVAARANLEHGLPLTGKERKRCVLTALEMKQYQLMTSVDIAREFGVSDKTVTKLRGTLIIGNSEAGCRKYKTKDGTTKKAPKHQGKRKKKKLAADTETPSAATVPIVVTKVEEPTVPSRHEDQLVSEGNSPVGRVGNSTVKSILEQLQGILTVLELHGATLDSSHNEDLIVWSHTIAQLRSKLETWMGGSLAA